MAKLSAHGTEVARLDITRTAPETEYRVVYSFRSDGHVLRKLGNDGWKLYKRLSEPKRATAARLRNLAQSMATEDERTTVNNLTYECDQSHTPRG